LQEACFAILVPRTSSDDFLTAPSAAAHGVGSTAPATAATATVTAAAATATASAVTTPAAESVEAEEEEGGDVRFFLHPF
jgi:hypothetical protein